MNLFTGLLTIFSVIGFVALWGLLIALGWLVGTLWRWFEGGSLD